MKIIPSIRKNLFTNSHPVGCEKNVLEQINNIKKESPFDGPKNVLIIGGSSGYGLASRISLALGCNSNTINVCFESGPKGKRSGTAGYWNNVAFHKHLSNEQNTHKDFLGDAFSRTMKEAVVHYAKETFGAIDLVIYSVASGARKNWKTGEVIFSKIKSLGKDVIGKTVDIKDNSVHEITVAGANPQEVADTVYVMGGSDWEDWMSILDENQLLSEYAKTISYTYIGGETTKAIYRDGTLGKAKTDLEETTIRLDKMLHDKYSGEALVSSSKAVATKASIYIPQMPIYVACLYDVMTKNNVHETIELHKYRLFKDMVYGTKRILDDSGRIRLDHLELSDEIQKNTKELMLSIDDEHIDELYGYQLFVKDLYNLNGFRNDKINYDNDIDIDSLQEHYQFTRVE